MPWAWLEGPGVSPLRFPMNPVTLYSCILFCACRLCLQVVERDGTSARQVCGQGGGVGALCLRKKTQCRATLAPLSLTDCSCLPPLCSQCTESDYTPREAYDAVPQLLLVPSLGCMSGHGRSEMDGVVERGPASIPCSRVSKMELASAASQSRRGSRRVSSIRERGQRTHRGARGSIPGRLRVSWQTRAFWICPRHALRAPDLQSIVGVHL